MPSTASGKQNTDARIAFALVVVVVLIAGYAASTRYDRFLGKPEAPPEALTATAAPTKSRAPEVDRKAQVKELGETVHALVSEERALPPARQPLPPETAPLAPPRFSTPTPAPLAESSLSPSANADEAAAKVAEAEALIQRAGLARPDGSKAAATSPAYQARLQRIAELRGRLTTTNAGEPAAASGPDRTQ